MAEDQERLCHLCGMPIEGDPVVLETAQGPLLFCCEGCRGVYQMLHEGEGHGKDQAGRGGAAEGKSPSSE